MSERLLTKKEVNQAHLYWYLAAETNNSYERLQAPSFCAAMAKNLRKIYKDDDEAYKEALQRHLEFYNTEGTIGAVVVGIALAMEEEKAKGNLTGDVITGIKLGLMGPIAGIGDTLIWGMSKAILLGMACTFALEGSPVALLFPPIFSIMIFVVGRCLLYTSSCLLQLLFIMNFGAVQNVMRSCQMKVHFLESLIVVRIAVINCGMIMIKWIQTCCSWQKQKTATEVTVF